MSECGDRVVAAANIAARVAARYARRVFWADRDDLEQEAMVAAFAALKTFDESVGVPFEGYVHRACAYQLARLTLRAGAPVSASWRDAPQLIGTRAVELDEELIESVPWSDEILEDADWQHRARVQLETVLCAGDAQAVAMRVLLDDERSADVAASTGLPIARVYKLTERARERAAKNAVLFELLKELSE